MKDVTSVGILAASTLLIASASAQSVTSPSMASPPAVNKVRNGYLKYNRTTTIGQALDGTFQNGKWKSFTTGKGITIIEFDGSEPFSMFRGGNPPDLEDCIGNRTCDALDKKIAAECSSTSGQAPYREEYENTKSILNAEIKDLDKQVQEEDRVLKPMDDHKAAGEQIKLQTEIFNLPSPEMSCNAKIWKEYATTPIPVAVQFSINHDGTFQYLANDTFTPENLFSKMYK